MDNKIEILIAIAVVFAVGLIFLSIDIFKPQVSNFEECANAGYQVMESYPRRCKTPDGKVFTEEVDIDKEEDEEEDVKQSKQKAKQWVEQNAPTYVYDGQDLQFIEERGLDLVGCEDCYEYEFEFTSRHAGYGNREGEMVAQVLTDHNIVVTVEDGNVTKAITDEKFDEMTGELLSTE